MLYDYRIVFYQNGGEKIGLSMKLVNQTTGKDLDPNNVQSSWVSLLYYKTYRLILRLLSIPCFVLHIEWCLWVRLDTLELAVKVQIIVAIAFQFIYRAESFTWNKENF